MVPEIRLVKRKKREQAKHLERVTVLGVHTSKGIRRERKEVGGENLKHLFQGFFVQRISTAREHKRRFIVMTKHPGHIQH